MIINIIYPLCSLGGIFGTLYGFSYGITSARNDIKKTFPRLNKNDNRIIGCTFVLRPNQIIVYAGIGFFLWYREI